MHFRYKTCTMADSSLHRKRSKGVKVNYLTRDKKLNAVKHILPHFFCNSKLKSLEICSFHVTCTKNAIPHIYHPANTNLHSEETQVPRT